MKSTAWLVMVLAAIVLAGCSRHDDTTTETEERTYAIGGVVSGVDGTLKLLERESGERLTVDADGKFLFNRTLEANSSYAIVVEEQPKGQVCRVSGGEGKVGQGDVLTIAVTCAYVDYFVGGTANGLKGAVTLQMNGGTLEVEPADGSFRFPAPLHYGDAYRVSLVTAPSSQVCTLNGAEGRMQERNVTDVELECVDKTYTIGGTIRDLNGSLSLLNTYTGGSGDVFSINIRIDSYDFTFAQALPAGTDYAVTVRLQPDTQECSVVNGTGTVGNADVTNIVVQCVDKGGKLFVKFGDLYGNGDLNGTIGLHTELSGGGSAESYDKTVTGTGTGTPVTLLVEHIDFGTDYNVTIASHPERQICSFFNGYHTGTIDADHKEATVEIRCQDSQVPASTVPFVFKVTGEDHFTLFKGDYPVLYDIDCNYTIGGGFEPEATGQTGNYRCEYTDSGEHVVAVLGIYPHFKPWGPSSNGRVTEIVQWGDQHWLSFKSSLIGNNTESLEIPAGSPDLSRCVSMKEAFANSIFNDPDIGDWNMSNVTTMEGMFARAKAFDQEISGWDVGHVTNMKNMFFGAAAFNREISGWDVSRVTTMAGMFDHAKRFDQPLNDWNVAQVTDMSYMFGDSGGGVQRDSTVFNHPLDKWDVSHVVKMTGMFRANSAFDQNISQWDVGRVTDMAAMFQNATSFNGPLNDWNVSGVESMHGMFDGAGAFDQPLDRWDTSNVVSMSYAFRDATDFNRPIGDWNTTGVRTMSYMFYNATSFDQNLSAWDVSKVDSCTGFAENAPIEGTDKVPDFTRCTP